MKYLLTLVAILIATACLAQMRPADPPDTSLSVPNLYGVSLRISKYVLYQKRLAFRLRWANGADQSDMGYEAPDSVEEHTSPGLVVLASIYDGGKSIQAGDTIDLYVVEMNYAKNTKTIVLKTGEKMRIGPDGELTPVEKRKEVATTRSFGKTLDLEEVLAPYVASGYSTTEIYPLLKGKLFHLTTVRVQRLRTKTSGLYGLSLPRSSFHSSEGIRQIVCLDFGTIEAPWMIRGATCKCVGTYSYTNALGLTSKVLNLEVIDPGEIDTDDGGWGR